MLKLATKKDPQASQEVKDITLPNLGAMKFVMGVTDEGYEIMYIKKKDFVPLTSLDRYKDLAPMNYYCRHEVKLSAFDKLVGVEIDQKLAIKIGDLRKWLIEQDALLGEILSSRRDVKL